MDYQKELEVWEGGMVLYGGSISDRSSPLNSNPFKPPEKLWHEQTGIRGDHLLDFSYLYPPRQSVPLPGLPGFHNHSIILQTPDHRSEAHEERAIQVPPCRQEHVRQCIRETLRSNFDGKRLLFGPSGLFHVLLSSDFVCGKSRESGGFLGSSGSVAALLRTEIQRAEHHWSFWVFNYGYFVRCAIVLGKVHQRRDEVQLDWVLSYSLYVPYGDELGLFCGV